ncbi:MAG: TlpA disulfide reductase family protein [Stagnimonas sp.]|nr:TlpA disulfide reductase family protein [Stagnimonas sp.]
MFKATRLRAVITTALLLSGFCAITTARAAAPAEPLKVLVFWGSFCSNCPAVMRQMDALREQYGDRNVQFVAVSLEGEEAPQQYLARKGYGFHIKTDGDALLARYQAVGVPWVVLTDAAGNAIANPSRGGAPREVADKLRLELDLRT